MNQIMQTMLLAITFVLLITIPVNAIQDNAQVDQTSPIIGTIGIIAAKEKIAQFMGPGNLNNQDLLYSGILDSPLGSAYELSQGNNRYYVNEKTGEVEFAYFPGSWSQFGTNVLSEKEAYEIALKFAETKYAKFTNTTMVPVESQMYNYGTAEKMYSFSWSEKLSGVLTLNRVYVSVDARNGKILSYQAKTNDTTVTFDPKITESAAKEIALGAFANPRESQTEAALMVVCLDKNDQKLAWVVMVHSVGENNIPQGGQAVIDALTGEILLANPFN
jgi:hypothetical protein